jgi:hypothetical protein
MATMPMPMLTMCCVCKQISGNTSCSNWIPFSTYLTLHSLQPAEVQLTHAYCPSCYEEQVRAWLLPTETLPPKAA